MSNRRIRNLFSNALNFANENAGLLGVKIPIMFDNVTPNTKPKDIKSQTHIVTHLVPAPVLAQSLGGDLLSYVGIYQMTIRVKAGESTADADDIVDELMRVFKVDSVFEEKDENNVTVFSVQIVNPISTAQGRDIDNWWVVPCSFEYIAHTT